MAQRTPAIVIEIAFEAVRPRVLAAYRPADFERIAKWLELNPDLNALVDDALRLEDAEQAA